MHFGTVSTQFSVKKRQKTQNIPEKFPAQLLQLTHKTESHT